MEFYVIILSTVFVAIAAETFSRYKPSEEFVQYGHGHLLEGDMILTEEQFRAIEKAEMSDDDEQENKVKNGLIDVTKRWPNKTVVYDFDEDTVFDIKQITIFEEALQRIADQSCIKFRKRENTDEYAVVVKKGEEDGCTSNIGYLGDQSDFQWISLSDSCFRHGIIIHEMLHTLGFYHMQSTYDRDDYVRIIWENIQYNHEDNFKKYNRETVTDFGVPYDYGSLMHYGKMAFTKNGKKTIIPKRNITKIGQKKRLSRGDIIKLNKMYNCPKNTYYGERL